MPAADLAPCPWCGSRDVRAEYVPHGRAWRHAVRCLGCGAHGPRAMHMQAAQDAWSRRHEPTRAMPEGREG